MDSGDAATSEGNMRPCGCHRGRPCTCEMGSRDSQDGPPEFECGECMNCRLNARTVRSSRPRRRCLQYNAYKADLNYDHTFLRANCVFRMRKPDWRTEDKSDFFNRMHQMRLAMVESVESSLTVIETQKELRRKLNRELVKAQEQLQQSDENKRATPYPRTNKLTRVDSNLFDSFSKQLVPVDALLPDLQALLDKANTTISAEETSIQIIREFVQDFAVRRLQSSFREFLRQRRWSCIWVEFKESVALAAVVTIQSAYRMRRARQKVSFLRQILLNRTKAVAAKRLVRFFKRIQLHRSYQVEHQRMQQQAQEESRKANAAACLATALIRIACRAALLRWKDTGRKATAHERRRTLVSVVLIQKLYRGYRVRIQLRRLRCLQSLSNRVHELVTRYIISGNFWGFILEIDADYRQLAARISEENSDALTFTETILKQRKLEEDRALQEWLTVSALESPIVRHCAELVDTLGSSSPKRSKSSNESAFSSSSTPSSLSSELLNSPLVEDLVSLGPNKERDDVLPDDMPTHAVRQAMAEGFSIDDVIAIMRGLQAQRKDFRNAKVVLKALRSRAPLMTNPWKSERVVRGELSPPLSDLAQKHPSAVASAPRKSKRISPVNRQKPTISISNNLIESIPGGLSAPIRQLVFVAAIKSFDPVAKGGEGAFSLPDDFAVDPFRSYLEAESPLVKIRREQQVMQAMKPFLQTLTENRCFTGFDVLYNIRGIRELTSWGVPEALARALYDVIEEVHKQSNHVSKGNLKRQVCVSAQFEEFLQSRQTRNEARIERASIDSVATIPDAVFMQVKERMERDVLQLPITNDSVDASDVIFKAAFMTCKCSPTEDAASSEADSYDSFLQTLVNLQTANNTDDMKALIRERVVVAKSISDRYLRRCNELMIFTASGMMQPNALERVRLDPSLHEQVSNLLLHLRSNPCTPSITNSKKTTNAAVKQLSPLIKQTKPILDSIDSDVLNRIKMPL